MCQTWWTEAHAAWAEAFALVLIFLLDLILGYFVLQERRDARQERAELRAERRRLVEDRQRSDVTCLGVRSIGAGLTEEQMFQQLWNLTNKQAGFALDKHLHDQLPQYLRRICEPHSREINLSTLGPAFGVDLLVLKLPYPDYSAVLSDLRTLRTDETVLVFAWDENDKKI